MSLLKTDVILKNSIMSSHNDINHHTIGAYTIGNVRFMTRSKLEKEFGKSLERINILLKTIENLNAYVKVLSAGMRVYDENGNLITYNSNIE